ncbi:uncharacterized protein [Epargyreus clarus]|uniref:uncharacterized protein n=1 Tax=Epargyreus clarus TaxID=520877 RepID=UPI003C2D025D
MEKHWITYIFIILSGYVLMAETTQQCVLSHVTSRCTYTVTCEVYAGSAENPNCEYVDPYVTFEMIFSRVDTLDSSFFSATSFDSRVRSIVANFNVWPTITREAFKFFFNTIRMDLSHNGIQDVYNDAFNRLFKMNYLNLSSNDIKTLYPKSFYTSDSRESLIQIIDLSKNKLTKLENKPFDDCVNLEELYLQNNNIESMDEDVFITLKNLTSLYLQYNKLTALNMTLINLKSLKELDLSFNKIGNISGFETNRLISLERVNMSFNNIEFIEFNCFNQAFNLQSIDLRNNNIKSSIPETMFINNIKLSYLNVFNNYIRNIAENAFQHNILVYLNLEKNFISGDITEATLAGLERLQNLNLFNQNITSIKANAFNKMTNLINFNASKNKINMIHESSFRNAGLLSILDLSHNNLSSLNFMKDSLTNLTELYLNNNRLDSIPGNTFINQTLIKKLDISMNRIITLEQYSLPLYNLQYLNISGNPISGAIKSNVLSPAKFLRYLDLSNLNISRIDNMALTDLPVLARLNLSNNIIEHIEPKNFLNLNNMFSLDLSYNKLSNLQLNGTIIENLNAIYLNNNELTNITEVLPNSTQIIYLDISNNNISEISSPALELLVNLRVLYASHNKIVKFNNPTVNRLSELYNLGLSSNQISQIDLSYFNNLVSLDISNNTLNHINSTLFQNLTYLQSLDISNNNISTLPPGVFRQLQFLKLLNISSNNLPDIRYGSLKGLHRMEVMDISRNKIAEIDIDMFHECSELVKLIIDYNLIKEFDIEELITVAPKLSSVSIGGNPVSCKQIVRNMKNINKTAERTVEVTSIDKIYHEDNVYGIRCGTVGVTTTTMATLSTSVPPAETSSLTLVIWCTVITMFFVLLTVGFFLYKRNNGSGLNFHPRLQLGRSVELTGTDFQNDLLN